MINNKNPTNQENFDFDPIIDYINNARQLRVNTDHLMAKGISLRGIV